MINAYNFKCFINIRLRLFNAGNTAFNLSAFSL